MSQNPIDDILILNARDDFDGPTAARRLLRQKGAQADTRFYEGKVAACQFFFRYHLPQAVEKLRYVASQDRSVLEAQASWFTGQ
ncbi:MAG: acyl-CoA dehydrogenase C-terminal domain-containing protein [Synechococcus sp. MOX_bin73]|nr:acyl-CoA dehydrogenase C-terminal domain-containing protein [Synechococcus sp. MOX_bin73]